jgi:hypothetical protein
MIRSCIAREIYKLDIRDCQTDIKYVHDIYMIVLCHYLVLGGIYSQTHNDLLSIISLCFLVISLFKEGIEGKVYKETKTIHRNGTIRDRPQPNVIHLDGFPVPCLPVSM